jgi:hypothetical protein
MKIFVGDQPFARYVFKDDKTLRPYFTDVRAPNGLQITRNHPPRDGDAADHADMHPGIWTAYGDINGVDFWRNRRGIVSTVGVDEMVQEPGHGAFTVHNEFRDGDKLICRQWCRYRIFVRPSGYLLTVRAEFNEGDGRVAFGDQEEMGLGVRVATGLTVKDGGAIVNADGLRNEAGAWGKQSAWADYSGVLNGTRIGVALMPHPRNFRPSWFHARDYGLLVANPFGRNAFTRGEKSRIEIEPGKSLVFECGVFVYATDAANTPLPPEAYADYLELSSRPEAR